MAADWYAGTLAGDNVVMLAERRHDVDDLNERARQHLTHGGVLTGPELSVAALTFQAGDRILCIRNNRRIGVRNGTLATVLHVDVENRALGVRADDGNMIRLPSQYLDDGHVRHGYARTVHKAQGLTVDRCLVLASDTLDHHAGYTALSRGRIENRIYLVEQPVADIEAHHQQREIAEPRSQLAVSLQTDRADRLAIDHGIDADALGADLARLLKQRATLIPLRLAEPPDRTAEIDALERERHELLRTLDASRKALADAAAHAPRLRLRQRHTPALLAAERARDHAADGLDRVQHQLDEARTGQVTRRQYRASNDAGLGKLAATECRITDRLEQLVDAHGARPPRYLDSLGPVPNTGWEREQWRRAVGHVEVYRAQNNVTDARQPFGPRPMELSAVAAWQHARATFVIDVSQLGAPATLLCERKNATRALRSRYDCERRVRHG